MKSLLKLLVISLALQGIFSGCTTSTRKDDPKWKKPDDIIQRYSASRSGEVMNISWQSDADTFYAVSYRDEHRENDPWRLLTGKVRGTGGWVTVQDRVHPRVKRAYRIKKVRY